MTTGPNTAEPRCWWCGIEPDDVLTVASFCGTHPEPLLVWPPGDHQHSVTPPTPQQLDADSHTTYRRIMERM